ncbi:MAG: hypothetical protein IPJ98_00255 [Bryobacterales bacterium]|nr:hypothetical protein [Bryobacterales bacterium]
MLDLRLEQFALHRQAEFFQQKPGDGVGVEVEQDRGEAGESRFIAPQTPATAEQRFTETARAHFSEIFGQNPCREDILQLLRKALKIGGTLRGGRQCIATCLTDQRRGAAGGDAEQQLQIAVQIDMQASGKQGIAGRDGVEQTLGFRLLLGRRRRIQIRQQEHAGRLTTEE